MADSSPRRSTRAGRYQHEPSGYRAFYPAALPPDPPLRLEGDLQALLSSADRALGRLDGSVQTRPNPDLFVFMYLRKEAVLSSQIEGTQSSLQDLLAAEADLFAVDRRPRDVDEHSFDPRLSWANGSTNCSSGWREWAARCEWWPSSERRGGPAHWTGGDEGADYRPAVTIEATVNHSGEVPDAAPWLKYQPCSPGYFELGRAARVAWLSCMSAMVMLWVNGITES